MTKEELLNLADRYQRKADRAFESFQETGIKRYDTERNNAEDLADALRMAAYAADEHNELVHMRGVLAHLVRLANEVMEETPVVAGSKEEEFLQSVLAYGRMKGMG